MRGTHIDKFICFLYINLREISQDVFNHKCILKWILQKKSKPCKQQF